MPFLSRLNAIVIATVMYFSDTSILQTFVAPPSCSTSSSSERNLHRYGLNVVGLCPFVPHPLVLAAQVPLEVQQARLIIFSFIVFFATATSRVLCRETPEHATHVDRRLQRILPLNIEQRVCNDW